MNPPTDDNVADLRQISEFHSNVTFQLAVHYCTNEIITRIVSEVPG
jgi:hypothetical protein